MKILLDILIKYSDIPRPTKENNIQMLSVVNAAFNLTQNNFFSHCEVCGDENRENINEILVKPMSLATRWLKCHFVSKLTTPISKKIGSTLLLHCREFIESECELKSVNLQEVVTRHG